MKLLLICVAIHMLKMVMGDRCSGANQRFSIWGHTTLFIKYGLGRMRPYIRGGKVILKGIACVFLEVDRNIAI